MKEKPKRVHVLVDKIPQELKSQKQWIIWKWVWNPNKGNDGGWDKPPYQATKPNEFASSTDSKTWSVFRKAYRASEDLEDYGGVGFAGLENTPYVGIDLDKCYDPNTGDIQEWADDIVQDFDSYTEVSPSQNGLRIWIKGKKPGPRCKKQNLPDIFGGNKGEIEIYDEGRYFTVTGLSLEGCSAEVEDRQDILDNLYNQLWPPKDTSTVNQTPSSQPLLSDDEIVEKAKNAANGEKFKRLWGGDWATDGYPTQSEADYALINMLIFWTQDKEQIERLMRKSQLSRGKWDESSWLQNQIEIALADYDGDLYECTPVRRSQADILVGIGQTQTLFHDQYERPYICLQSPEYGRKIVPINSRHSKRWLGMMFHKTQSKAPGSDGLNAAVNTLEGYALFDSPQYKLSNRVAWHDGAIFYALGDKKGRMVKISPGSWEIIGDDIEEELPILFRYTEAMGQQTEPVRDGDAELLFKYIDNFEKPTDKELFLICVIAAMVPEIPHPLIVFNGPEGSTKTTKLRILRMILDPSPRDVSTLPKTKRNTSIQLSKNWACLWDNVSYLSPEQMDTICRAVTGATDTERALFTDDDEITFDLMTVVGISGIPVVITRGDTMDRTLLFQCERVDESNVIDDVVFIRDLKKDMPRILGGVFDLLANAMELKTEERPEWLPRLAGFGHWALSIAEAQGIKEGRFIQLYKENMDAMRRDLVESDVVVKVLTSFMAERAEWEGTSQQLLNELESVATDQNINIRQKSWPKAANSLSRKLSESSVVLEELGIIRTKDQYITSGRVTGQKYVFKNLNYGEPTAMADDSGVTNVVAIAAVPAGFRRGRAVSRDWRVRPYIPKPRG